MSLRTRINQAIIAFSLFAAGGVAVWYLAVPHGTRVFTDGEEIIDEQIWETSRRVVWEPPTLIEGVSTADEEGDPALSPDGRFLFYTAGMEGGLSDLWMARVDGGGEVVDRRPLDELNSPFDDRDPFPFRDSLYFVSNRPGTRGGFDVFVASREGEGFGEPRPLGVEVNGPSNERRPVLDAAGEILLFASDRDDPGAKGGFDLYRSDRSDSTSSSEVDLAGGKFSDAVALIDLNSAADDVDPFLWPDGSRIVFSSDREGGRGGFDLWETVFSGDDWLEPRPVADLNTVDHERSPSAARNGFSLVFSSERPWGEGLSDLYRTDSRELFPLPGERGLADLIAQILFLLLLLLALFAFLANRWKKLDIVVKCIMLSILLHLLLLLWFRTVDLTGALDQRSSRGQSYKIRFVPRTPSQPPADANLVRGDQLEEAQRDRGYEPEPTRESTPLAAVSQPSAASTTQNLVARGPQAKKLRTREKIEQEIQNQPERRRAEPLPVAAREVYETSDPARRVSASELLVSRAEAPRGVRSAEKSNRPVALSEVAFEPREARVEEPARSLESELPTRKADSWEPATSQNLVSADVTPLEVSMESEALYEAADPEVADATSRELEVSRVSVEDSSVERLESFESSSQELEMESEEIALELPSTVELADASAENREAVRENEPLSPDRDLPEIDPLEFEPIPVELAESETEEPALSPEVAVQDFELERTRTPLEPMSFGRDPRRPLVDFGSPTETLVTGSQRIGSSALPTLDLTAPVAGRRESVRPQLERGERELSLDRDPAFENKLPTLQETASVSVARDPEPSVLTAQLASRTLIKQDVFDVTRGVFEVADPKIRARSASFVLAAPAPDLEVDRGGDSAPLAGLYVGRTEAGKKLALEEFGGSEESERAVQRGLAYLARIQRSDGSWGRASHDDSKYGYVRVGKTALSLLAFLASGHTQFSETTYSRNARSAIDFLLGIQDEQTGHFGVTSSYSHGIATYALAESYAMTRDPRLKEPLVYAVAWILFNQYLDVDDPRWVGGWGYYYPDGRFVADKWPRASVTAWQVMALKSAMIGGLEIPERHLSAARTYLRNSFDVRKNYFRYTHDPDRLRSPWPTLPASTPASIFALMLLGEERDDPRIARATQFVIDRVPRRYRRASDDDFVLEGQGNLYFWYYSTLSMFMLGGEEWAIWNASMRDLLIDSQNEDGSWTPISPYSRYADERSRDRSYTTAMNVLTLEIYYRYFPPLLRQQNR